MELYNRAGVDILAYLSLRDTVTSTIYKLGIKNGKLTLERFDNSNYQDFIYLLDTTTSKLYRLSVYNSKLIMEETSTLTYNTSLHFLDEDTGMVYELRVADGKLILEDAENFTREIKEVDLLSYWLPILRNIKEFKEIAKAERPEIIYILEAIDTTLSNTFIETSDEYGIKRFEKMMGIYPEEGDTLETRRFRVMVKWNEETPYTLETLKNQIEILCGNDGYSVIMDYENYTLSVKLNLYNEKNIETVKELLAKVVPANIVTVVSLFNTHEILSSFTHEYLSAFTHKEVREDVLN